MTVKHSVKICGFHVKGDMKEVLLPIDVSKSADEASNQTQDRPLYASSLSRVELLIYFIKLFYIFLSFFQLIKI